MDSSLLEKITAFTLIFLGITVLLWLVVFIFNITSLISLFIICAFVLFILAFISGIFMFLESKSEAQ